MMSFLIYIATKKGKKRHHKTHAFFKPEVVRYGKVILYCGCIQYNKPIQT